MPELFRHSDGMTIRERREFLQLTQQEAAAIAGVSEQTWAAYENGHKSLADSYPKTRRGINAALQWAKPAAAPNPRGIRTLDQRFEDLTPKQQDAIRAAFDAFEAGA
jgi:DNA-binding XRE family transcriptional regulator